MTAYAERDELKGRLAIDLADVSQDATLDGLLEQAARYLEGECERDFWRHPALEAPALPDEVRIIRTTGRSRRIPIRMGAVALTSVQTGTSPAGPWTTVAASEYAFDPFELPPDETNEQLLLLPTSAYRKWPEGYARLAGVLGFAAVPGMIHDANLDGAQELYRQGPGGGGPVGVNQFGTPMFMRGVPKSVLDAVNHYAWRRRDFSRV